MLARIMTSAAVLGLTAGMAAAEYKITILHTNDFHARFEPISKYDSGCSAEDNTAGECFGGSARLVTAVEAARARAGNVLLLDGGDQFQGTLFYTYYKGKAAAEMMNKMSYDAMTVGNHEFDDGPEGLKGFTEAVDFPILMSNADLSGEPILSGAIEKSVIIEKDGEKIGLIGLTPQNTDELASPGPNIIFRPRRCGRRRGRADEGERHQQDHRAQPFRPERRHGRGRGEPGRGHHRRRA